ncbi:MAG: hypothetical protein KJO65_03260 [Gemmatimonadetes bacterium]|nr:hypothetical protein [Gemmatimonadota bacterium]
MNCHQARSAMLEASATVLRGAGEGELSAHVAQCADCAAIAREMAGVERRLHDTLDDLAASHDVEETLEAVHTRLAGGEAHALRSPASKWRRGPLILAAAAVAAALALWGDEIVESTRPPAAVDVERLVTTTEQRGAPPTTGELAVEADQRFAFMKTDKPTISVVWFY